MIARRAREACGSRAGPASKRRLVLRAKGNASCGRTARRRYRGRRGTLTCSGPCAERVARRVADHSSLRACAPSIVILRAIRARGFPATLAGVQLACTYIARAPRLRRAGPGATALAVRGRYRAFAPRDCLARRALSFLVTADRGARSHHPRLSRVAPEGCCRSMLVNHHSGEIF